MLSYAYLKVLLYWYFFHCYADYLAIMAIMLLTEYVPKHIFKTKLMFFKVYGNVNGNKMIVNVQKNICLHVM